MDLKEIENTFKDYIFWAIDLNGNTISSPVKFEWINKLEKTFRLIGKL